MSNIVKQINLHLKGNEVENIEELLSEAADEIERLRAENAKLTRERDAMQEALRFVCDTRKRVVSGVVFRDQATAAVWSALYERVVAALSPPAVKGIL